METSKEKKYTEAEQDFPGAAIDRADDEKVDTKKVKSEVCTLNNNPRNNEIDE